MTPPLTVRRMERADLPFGDSLRALAGWNQTPADWERFIRLRPEGCFLAEWKGAPAGTATTIAYGTELAWIGMVLVHPEYRRRGIGSRLLRECIQHLREANVRCIKLDATPQGRPVYEALGFSVEWTLRRWEAELPVVAPGRRDVRVRSWTDAEAARSESIDLVAFGASRTELIRALAAQSSLALTAQAVDDSPAGFGLLRPGARAYYLGPVSAASPGSGLALVEALTAQAPGGRVFWDVPDPNSTAVQWAEKHGFRVQRSLTRMYLGDNHTPGDPRHQFALAGPEVG